MVFVGNLRVPALFVVSGVFNHTDGLTVRFQQTVGSLYLIAFAFFMLILVVVVFVISYFESIVVYWVGLLEKKNKNIFLIKKLVKFYFEVNWMILAIVTFNLMIGSGFVSTFMSMTMEFVFVTTTLVVVVYFVAVSIGIGPRYSHNGEKQLEDSHNLNYRLFFLLN